MLVDPPGDFTKVSSQMREEQLLPYLASLEGDDWRTDPFQFTVQGDRYVGRGATDDKGPAVTALLGAIAARDAGVPVNIAFLWELEEEIGSTHFEFAISQDPARFKTENGMTTTVERPLCRLSCCCLLRRPRRAR